MEEDDHAAEEVADADERSHAAGVLREGNDEAASSSLIPTKRKVAGGEEAEELFEKKDDEEGHLARSPSEVAMIKAEDDEMDNAVQYASVVEQVTQPISVAPPPKKKAKGKAGAKGVKGALKETTSARASVSAEETGTSEVETPMVVRKVKKKAAASTLTKGKKRKASTQISASSTPAAIREDSATLHEQDELQDNIAEDEEEDKNKLHCFCKRTYDDEMMMIACDYCDEWYHTDCIKMDASVVNLVAFYICPTCEPLTAQRTEFSPQCARPDCTNRVKSITSRYCCDECGLLAVTSRMSKCTQLRTLTALTIVEKLASSQVMGANKKQGVAKWSTGADRRRWLENVLERAAIPVGQVEDLDDQMLSKAFELPEMETLARLEARRVELEIQRSNVNATLDALAARTKLLHLAEDRAPLLEPLQDEEDSRAANGKKGNSKSKRIKQEDEVMTGQPRCGYDDRLSWDDARFHAWCQTTKAKDILDDRAQLDGVLHVDDDEDCPIGEVAICGRSRRKCKQHLDWSGIRAADMEGDRDAQITLLSSLNEEEQVISSRVKQLHHFIKDTIVNEEERRRERDAALARQLANEGTRRAIQTR